MNLCLVPSTLTGLAWYSNAACFVFSKSSFVADDGQYVIRYHSANLLSPLSAPSLLF